eukprot:3606631-Prymnesium_polylepis.1
MLASSPQVEPRHMLPHCAGGDGADTQHPVQSQPSFSKDAQSLMLSVAEMVPQVLIWHGASQPSIAGALFGR